MPLTLIISNSNFVSAEQAKNPQARRVQTDIYFVGPDFFSTMGIPLLAGEGSADTGASSAVVNDTFQRMAFAGESRSVGVWSEMERLSTSSALSRRPNPALSVKRIALRFICRSLVVWRQGNASGRKHSSRKPATHRRRMPGRPRSYSSRGFVGGRV